MGFTMRLLDNAQHAQCCIHTSETKARGIITDPAVSPICVRSQSKVAAASNFQSVEEYSTELCAWESALGRVEGVKERCQCSFCLAAPAEAETTG